MSLRWDAITCTWTDVPVVCKLTFSDKLLERLIELREKRVRIAEELLKFESTDLKVDYIGLSQDNPNFLSYASKDRIEKYPNDIWSGNRRYKAKPATVVEKILPGMFTDKEKQEFTLLFRNESCMACADTDVIKIVEGEYIRDYYLDTNYAPISGTTYSLQESCMRYGICQKYLDIYVFNPEKIKMAVILDDNDKVKARSILWFEGENKYHDRIYYCDLNTYNLMHSCLEKLGFINISEKNDIKPTQSVSLTIKLKTHEVDYYPYVDTMCYYNSTKGYLTNDSCSKWDYELTHTDGRKCSEDEPDEYECDHCGDTCSETYYISRGNHRGDNVCEDCAVYSEHYREYIHTADAAMLHNGEWVLNDDVVEDYRGHTIVENDSIELWDGDYAHEDDNNLLEDAEGDYFIAGDDNFVVPRGSSTYHKVDSELIEEIDGEYYLINSDEWIAIKEMEEENV